jgi:hypothetical protein
MASEASPDIIATANPKDGEGERGTRNDGRIEEVKGELFMHK